MFSSRGTVRYEERGQGYRDVEKVGKHCLRVLCPVRRPVTALDCFLLKNRNLALAPNIPGWCVYKAKFLTVRSYPIKH